MSKKGMKYDYKKAHDKNLPMSERFHYLENARHDQDTGSPNKFMGGIAAAAGQIGMKNSSIMSGFLENNTAYQIAMGRKQAQQAPQAQQVVGASATGVAPTSDMSGDPVLQAAGITGGGAMDQANPFEGKTFQITPANMMGNAKPVFNEQTQGMAQTAFGSALERQMSMPNSGSVTQMKSPLEGNAFIGAKMAAEKAGESTFEVDGKTFNVK